MPRPALIYRLSGGTPVVLVSAPAPFGKTTLRSRWLAGADIPQPMSDGRAVAWVYLDEGDRDAASFWTHVLTAVDRAVPGVRPSALALLQAGHAPAEPVLVGRWRCGRRAGQA